MKIVSAATLNDDIRITMSEIFVDGFYQWLHFFSKDKVKLAKALSHMFLLGHFYVGLIDEKVAGFVAYTNGLYAPIKLNKKLLKKTFRLY